MLIYLRNLEQHDLDYKINAKWPINYFMIEVPEEKIEFGTYI